MKKNSIVKTLAATLAMALMMSITVFASETETISTEHTSEIETTSETETVSEIETVTEINTISENSLDEDVDSAKAGLEEEETAQDSGMNANVVKDDTETVKTGEFNMIPIIVGLAVIAAGAGAGYMIWRKKNK